MNMLERLGLNLGSDAVVVRGAATASGTATASGAAAANGAANGAPRGTGAAGAPFAPCPPAQPGGHGGTGPGPAGGGWPRKRGRPARTNGAPNGATKGAAHRPAPFVPLDARQVREALLLGSLNGNAMDAAAVIFRLEEAGQTLLALPSSGWSTRLRTTRLDVVRNAIEGYGWDSARGERARLRPAMPDSARIDRMDEAMGWIPLIPRDRYVLRRIVGARSLVSPVTDRHLFTWRRLGLLLGADHKAIQRWHAQGIDLIVKALRGGVTRAD